MSHVGKLSMLSFLKSCRWSRLRCKNGIFVLCIATRDIYCRDPFVINSDLTWPASCVLVGSQVTSFTGQSTAVSTPGLNWLLVSMLLNVPEICLLVDSKTLKIHSPWDTLSVYLSK